MSQDDKPKRGRPITRKTEIHASAKEIARAIFAAAKPPGPSKRKARKQIAIAIANSVFGIASPAERRATYG